MRIITLKLGMKQAADGSETRPKTTGENDRGSNGVAPPPSASPLAQSKGASEPPASDAPSPNPLAQNNTTPSTPATAITPPKTTHTPPLSRLRPRLNRPNTSTRPPGRPRPAIRKPRKPTKHSLHNGRAAFAKTKAWQEVLRIATESLERSQPECPIMLTERERVLAKRIVADRAVLREQAEEIERLKRMCCEQREVIGKLRREVEWREEKAGM